MKTLVSILVCPKCHNRLELRHIVEGSMGIKEGKLLCMDCKKEYSIREGIFYLDSDMRSKTVNVGENEWKLADFENMYFQGEYHKSHIDYLERKQGLPKKIAKVVGEYDNSRVKGKLIEWLTPTNGDVVLDVGCGVGYFIFDIINEYPHLDMYLIGIDALTNCVRYLKQRKYEESKMNILPVVADTEFLPFMDGSIDIIASSELLEHVPNPQKALSEMSRVLKKDGKLLVSTPNRMALEFWQSISSITRKLGLSKRQHDCRDDFYDKPLYWKQLKEFSESAGLTIKRYEFNVNPLMRKILIVFPKNIADRLIDLLEPWLKGERWGTFTLVEFKKLLG